MKWSLPAPDLFRIAPTLAVLFQVTLAWAEDAVTMLKFGADGKALGSYSLVSPGKWVEFNLNGDPQFEFEEVSRTSATIVVEDKSRNIALTFDLAGNIITYGLIGDTQEPLYSILEVESAEGIAPAVAKTEAASTVAFGSNGEVLGSYVNSAPSVWEERDNLGKTNFTFVEEGRRDGSILLRDETRGLALTLNLAEMKISFGAVGDAEQQPLYEILSADSQTVTESEEVATPSSDQIPSQVKLKNLGSYQGKFTVTWTPDGSDETESWTSDEQPAPYFHALSLPVGSSAIRILGEASINGEWMAILDRSIDVPTNKCYVLIGSETLADNRISEEPSDNPGDDCDLN